MRSRLRARLEKSHWFMNTPRRAADLRRVLLAACCAALLGACAEGGYTIGGPPRASLPPQPPQGSPAAGQETDGWSEPSAATASRPAAREPMGGGWGTSRPLTVSRALGQGDAAREASMQLVLQGLDEDEGDRPSRALASYQRAVRLDSTNPFAYLALARHHLEYGSLDEAGAFLDQARAGFESEGRLGPAVDVWGLGLRAWIDRARGQDSTADRRFRQAQALAPSIWADELLSAGELR